MQHIPVLAEETLDLLAPKSGEIFLDCTLGLGGHARLVLEKIGKKGKLIGLDADTRNLEIARENLKEFPNTEFHHTNFRNLRDVVAPESVDGVLFDLGVSSPHFDDAERGFSYRSSGPLDLRFDLEQPLTAAGILNGLSENEIAEILRDFGEIRTSKKVARAIIEKRRHKKFHRTEDLVEVIEAKSLLPQVFQALRIAVNDELGALQTGLSSAVEALKSGGRIAVISFHSLEDRIVKNFFRDQKKLGILEVLTKKPIIPSSAEVQENLRSRSAKLRCACKDDKDHKEL